MPPTDLIHATPVRTLYVVDDQATRESLEFLLKSCGHEQTKFFDADGAWKEYVAHPYPLVVIDLPLSGNGGLKLCADIRAHSESKNTTVLICTELKSHDRLEEIINVGADDFLSKPFDIDEVKIRLRLAANQVQLRIEAQNTEHLLWMCGEQITRSEDAIISKTLNGTIAHWNLSACKLFGYTATEAIGKSIMMIVPEDRRDEVNKLMDKLRMGEHVAPLQTVRIRKDGQSITISMSLSPVKDRHGRVIGATVISRDISEKQRIVESLRLGEAKYRKLCESNLIGIIYWTLDGRIVDANDTFLKMVQYTREEMLAGMLSWRDMTPFEHEEGDKEVFAQLLEHGQCQPFEKEFIRKDGILVPVCIGALALGDEVKGNIAFILDLTSKRILEEQLRQSQKMDAIGRLAGGIAHDFNNLLTVIIGRSELMLQRIDADNILFKDTNLIKATGERAANLTRQLLQFSRQQVLQPKLVSVKKVVLEMEPMLRRLIPEDIQLSFILPKALGRIKVDPSQLEQVILNLAVNARDAMPRGGKLTIEATNVDLDDEYASHHLSVRPGPYVLLCVSDTGEGMDEKTKARLFEPFFTTKELGKGTGLGLSTVFGIVTQSGGFVWVYSELNQGTVFKVYFPESKESGAEIPSSSSSSRLPIQAGKETILLVEDEVEVAQLIHDILIEMGYKVLVTNNAEEAIRISENEKGSIQLLLTDVVMPRMSGRQLATLLTGNRPAMKVVFMSGYAGSAIVNHGVLDEGTEFLQKPFTTGTLGRKIREALTPKV